MLSIFNIWSYLWCLTYANFPVTSLRPVLIHVWNPLIYLTMNIVKYYHGVFAICVLFNCDDNYHKQMCVKKVCTFCFCHTFIWLNLVVWHTWATFHVHTIPHPFSQNDFLLAFLLWCSSMNQWQEWFILPCILNNMCFPAMWCRLMAPFMSWI